MIASMQTLRKLQPVSPFCERTRDYGVSYGVGPAGYDVRLDQDVILAPGAFKLGSTLEKFNMPRNLLGIVHDKSTWARMGIALQNTVIEPGWMGFLTLEITNHGRETITLPRGCGIAQIIFHFTDAEVEQGYSGKYQDQGRGPQGAIFDITD